MNAIYCDNKKEMNSIRHMRIDEDCGCSFYLQAIYYLF